MSLDKIKDALKQPPSALTLRSLDETPTFRMQILERQKVEELLASLFFKSTPGPFGGYTPGGGFYGYEMQRQMFPAVDNPMRQPYAAFSGGELLTILIENLVGRYLAGRAIDAISNAERARAEAAAKEEVRNAVIAILRGPAERRSRAADLRNDCSLSPIRRPPAQLLHRRENTMVRNTFRRLVPFATAALLVALESTASAQYFGRNKVQFKDLDFEVMKTEHFDIYFYPEEREGIDIAARMSERWLARLERVLSHQLRGRQPLVLYASHPDFEQTNTIQGELGEGTGGVTESLRRRIVLPLGGPLADTDHVIGHELVHAFQYDMTTRAEHGAGTDGRRAGCRCGSSKAWPSTCRSVRSIQTPRCGCVTRRGRRRMERTPARTRCPQSKIWTIRSTSPTAGDRRSGRSSGAPTATT